MNKRRFRRGRLILHPPRRRSSPPSPLRSGPERVRLPTRELPSRPFAALESLLWEMQRQAGKAEQPPMPETW
jgi:hypothetical protein